MRKTYTDKLSQSLLQNMKLRSANYMFLVKNLKSQEESRQQIESFLNKARFTSNNLSPRVGRANKAPRRTK